MGLIFPVESEKITSYFGARNTGIPGASTYHEGIDIAVVSGTPVKAAHGGVVVASGYNNTSGNYVKIQAADGLTTFYGHLSKRNVSTGQTVAAGEIIAYSGNTGVSSGAHLHFGVYQNGVAVDPLTFIGEQAANSAAQIAAATAGLLSDNTAGIIIILASAALLAALFR